MSKDKDYSDQIENLRQNLSDQYQCNIPHLPQRLPTLFSIDDPVLDKQVQRIGKNTGRDFETNAVFALIDAVFLVIPDKAPLRS